MEDRAFSISNESRPAGVPAVARAARVLDVVADAPRALGISEIARRSGLSKSSVHALVNSLVDEGLLGADGRGYHLGGKLLELGSRARDQRLLEVVESELQRLADAKGETALFGRVAGDRVLILAARQSRRMLNLSASTGSSVPVLAGALGKAFLAATDPEDAVAFLRRHPLPHYTEKSPKDASAYLEAVEIARQREFALERGEYLPGIAAVAAAFSWLGTSYLLWAIGIAANYTDDELRDLGEAVRDSIRRIEERLRDDVTSTDERSAM